MPKTQRIHYLLGNISSNLYSSPKFNCQIPRRIVEVRALGRDCLTSIHHPPFLDIQPKALPVASATHWLRCYEPLASSIRSPRPPWPDPPHFNQRTAGRWLGQGVKEEVSLLSLGDDNNYGESKVPIIEMFS